MPGLEVGRRQRAARALLEEVLAVAKGTSIKARASRAWLTTPSELLRILLGQAGYTPEMGAMRVAPRGPVAGRGPSGVALPSSPAQLSALWRRHRLSQVLGSA